MGWVCKSQSCVNIILYMYLPFCFLRILSTKPLIWRYSSHSLPAEAAALLHSGKTHWQHFNDTATLSKKPEGAINTQAQSRNQHVKAAEHLQKVTGLMPAVDAGSGLLSASTIMH